MARKSAMDLSRLKLSKDDINKIIAMGRFFIESLMQYRRMVAGLRQAVADGLIDDSEKSSIEALLSASEQQLSAAIAQAEADEALQP